LVRDIRNGDFNNKSTIGFVMATLAALGILYLDYPVAKATYVRTKNHWKIFWIRADFKWYAYPAQPTVQTLQEFTQLVKEDKHVFGDKVIDEGFAPTN